MEKFGLEFLLVVAGQTDKGLYHGRSGSSGTGPRAFNLSAVSLGCATTRWNYTEDFPLTDILVCKSLPVDFTSFLLPPEICQAAQDFQVNDVIAKLPLESPAVSALRVTCVGYYPVQCADIKLSVYFCFCGVFHVCVSAHRAQC